MKDKDGIELTIGDIYHSEKAKYKDGSYVDLVVVDWDGVAYIKYFDYYHTYLDALKVFNELTKHEGKVN